MRTKRPPTNLVKHRLYRCADCGRLDKITKQETTHRCKPRCNGCGGTFFEYVQTVVASAPNGLKPGDILTQAQFEAATEVGQ